MITEEKLAKLRKTWSENGWYDEDPTTLMPDLMDTLSALWRVVRAAEGLCHGTDWNKGTHAITHGYRQKLIDAVVSLREEEKK